MKFRHQWENIPKDHIEGITNKTSESTSTNAKKNAASTTISSPQVTSVSESVPAHQTEVTTRTGRTIKPPTKFADTDHSSIHSYLSTFYLGSDKAQEHLLQPNISSSVEPHPFALFSEYMLSFLATDPDTMTLQEAMQQPDKDQFLHAMKKELEDHISRKHWKVVPAKCIPKHKRSIPMVWSMKRKRNPVGEIIKWKARLCVGGHRTKEFVDYWETYSPVVSWQTIRMIFIFAVVNNWHIHSIDFVLAFPQADIQTDIYLQPSPPNPFLFSNPRFTPYE